MTDAVSGPGLPVVYGHDSIRERVAAAAEAGRFPQSLLLHGPEGVGKRTLALWTAALLSCDGGAPRPCGRCRSCRLAARLEHPDIHYHFPMPRPGKASSPRKLREALETSRSEALARMREDPAGASAAIGEGEVTGIYLGAVETVRAQASRRPAMGTRAVFVIAEADRMVPQRSSPEAANAFLKLLEEPPDFAWLILTSSRPAGLLPTIRSRTTGLRIAPLEEDVVARCLLERWDVEPARAATLARRADGSIGRALALLRDEEDAPGTAADALLRAALRGGTVVTYGTALRYQAREPERIARIAGDRRPSIEGILAALDAVREARELAERNLNPQAVVAVLLRDMHRALVTPGPRLAASR